MRIDLSTHHIATAHSRFWHIPADFCNVATRCRAVHQWSMRPPSSEAYAAGWVPMSAQAKTDALVEAVRWRGYRRRLASCLAAASCALIVVTHLSGGRAAWNKRELAGPQP